MKNILEFQTGSRKRTVRGSQKINAIDAVSGKPKLLLYIGKNIRHLRSSLGISSERLGAALGKDFSYVDQIEDGTVDLDVITLNHCADILGVSFDELLSAAGPSR